MGKQPLTDLSAFKSLTTANVLTIGAELRQVREACGLSLNCVGQRLTVNPNYISRVERGEHLPGLYTLVRLAEAYGLEVQLVPKATTP